MATKYICIYCSDIYFAYLLKYDELNIDDNMRLELFAVL